MPVAHSLSPIIHQAGYVAAGLTEWSYTAHECAAHELAEFVASRGPEWTGLSLTMPLKEAALAVADETTSLAAALDAANTLVRRDGRWLAENTDAPGMVDALRCAGLSRAGRVAVLGAGGTARAVLAAAAQWQTEQVVVYARRPGSVDELAPVAERLSVPMRGRAWSHVTESVAEADIVVSTVPAGAADVLADVFHRGFRRSRKLTVFDVLYHPWPTGLAAAAAEAGCIVVGGRDLLLAQAVRQFELFTGVEAPVSAMREALRSAVAAR